MLPKIGHVREGDKTRVLNIPSDFQSRFKLAFGAFLTVIVSTVFTVIAFGLLSPPRDVAALIATPVPTRPPIPTSTPVVLPAVPPLLLTDNFSTRGNWARGSSQLPFEYVSNGYRLAPRDPGGFSRVLIENFSTANVRDFSVEAEGAPSLNSTPVEYGVLFLHDQQGDASERFMFFTVSSEGSFRLRGYVAPRTVAPSAQTPTAQRWIELVPATASFAVKTNGQPNRLRVDVHPHRLLAYVNDALVFDRTNVDIDQYRDRSDYDGRIGLISVGLGKPGAQVIFTNFKLFADVKP